MWPRFVLKTTFFCNARLTYFHDTATCKTVRGVVMRYDHVLALWAGILAPTYPLAGSLCMLAENVALTSGSVVLPGEIAAHGIRDRNLSEGEDHNHVGYSHPGYPDGLPDQGQDTHRIESATMRMRQLEWHYFYNPSTAVHGLSGQPQASCGVSGPRPRKRSANKRDTAPEHRYSLDDRFPDHSVVQDSTVLPENVDARAAMRMRDQGPLWVVHHGDGEDDIEHRFDLKIIWELGNSDNPPRRMRE